MKQLRVWKESGKAVNALDVLIAGIAIANGAEKVATRDGDFMEISKVAELEVKFRFTD